MDFDLSAHFRYLLIQFADLFFIRLVLLVAHCPHPVFLSIGSLQLGGTLLQISFVDVAIVTLFAQSLAEIYLSITFEASVNQVAVQFCKELPIRQINHVDVRFSAAFQLRKHLALLSLRCQVFLDQFEL